MSDPNEERVLVLAPIGRDAELTAGALRKAGFHSQPCAQVEQLCTCIEEGAAVVIVGEEALTEAAIECISSVLNQQAHWSDLPFVILTAGGRSTELSLSHAQLLERLGHVTLLERPLRIVTMVTAVRAGLRSRRRQYELRGRIDALRRSEERFRSVFEHAAVGIAIFGPDRKFVEVNAAFTEITGYTPSELVNMSEMNITHPEDEAAARQRHGGVGEEQRSVVATEKRYVRKTGEAVWVRVSTSSVHDDEGRLLNTISLVEEITYRRQAEEALAAQAAELARSNADLQQFAWVTSHDLREPIRNLIAFSQLLSLRYKDQLDAEGLRALDFIESSSRRMESLVRDLLSYSRVVNAEDRGFMRVSLAGALDWAMSNLEVSLNDARASVVRGDLPDVCGDEVQIVQLLQNLLSNAIKYRGAETPQIYVSGVVREGFVEISFKDNGIGIDPRYHDRVFGLFKRLHGPEIQGTGLGLAICRKIVERHGGTIRVDSEPDHGANFIFTLPTPE
ncbi:MAG TPA: ATP-binding protein [Bryobacteraceae bacterium]|nr:ATP-binding protein [Bryobacteraceae bacterium]